MSLLSSSTSAPSYSSLSSSSAPALMTAREAYRKGDIHASIQYHNSRPHMVSCEHHAGAAADYLKSVVYGGLDGIITTFATVTSTAGAELSAAVIVILGISHLFADGLSMGMGDWLSSQAEVDYNNAERRREQWEMENNLEGEIQEMVELYMRKGLTREDSETIINTLAKYEEPFLDHMMVEELGLMKPQNDFTPVHAGLATMFAFMAFGLVPLLPYLIALIPGVAISPSMQLGSSVVLTVITLFILGALKGQLVQIGKTWYFQGLAMAANGSFAAIVGYAVGWAMADVVGNNANTSLIG